MFITKVTKKLSPYIVAVLRCFDICQERLKNLTSRRKRSRKPEYKWSREQRRTRKREEHDFFSLWPELSDGNGKPRKIQKSSHLLKLPFEIREEIFTLVIGTELLHLVDMGNRTGYIRCSQKYDTGDSFWKQKRCDRNCASPLWRFVSYSSTPTIEWSSGFPPLLLTCRQNYAQGVGILYSCNVFEVEYPETVVSLSHTIRPHLLESIRFLQISGRARVLKSNAGVDRCWDEMWEVICHQMKALRSLHVKMRIQLHGQFNQPTGWSDKAQSMLKQWLAVPAENLRGLKSFELCIDTAAHDDQLRAFQDKLEMLICSSLPKGTSERFSELFTGLTEDMGSST